MRYDFVAGDDRIGQKKIAYISWNPGKIFELQMGDFLYKQMNFNLVLFLSLFSFQPLKMSLCLANAFLTLSKPRKIMVGNFRIGSLWPKVPSGDQNIRFNRFRTGFFVD